MPRAVAINVGANTNEPGFRGPVYDDGSFVFVPIPESAPTREAPPTYGDLGLPLRLPDGVRDVPVHLDPEFATYPHCERYTYGDPFGVKARPLLELSAGDYALFYATLTRAGEPPAVDGGPSPTVVGERPSAADADHPHPDSWAGREWGAYLVGQFRLAHDPVAGDDYADLPATERARFATNAHVRRETFDAAVLLAGDDDSRLYDRAVPLSGERGTEANHLVTDLSADSGKGPWWRRPLRFDEAATAALLDAVDSPHGSPVH